MHVVHVVGARPNFMKVSPALCAVDDIKNWRQAHDCIGHAVFDAAGKH